MSNAIFNLMQPKNEMMLTYLPGSREKQSLKNKITEMKSSVIDIPLIIDGKEIRTGKTGQCVIPHNHGHLLANYHMAGPEEMEMAIESALKAKVKWQETPWEHRVAVFMKAAELISGPWRDTLNAATMLGQSKTVHEADADSACELMDFFRFNSFFVRQLMEEQPNGFDGVFNRMEHRPLEGFVFAVTPFNFTAIAGNLPSTPAMAGNTSVWKPASSAIYSNYFVMKLLQESGLPDGVINFVPGTGSIIGPMAMEHEMLAGIHFTGSTATFNRMWRTIAGNLEKYRSYPRIVGETGGKDFLFAHSSADVEPMVHAIIGGGFSYQGQKCSATSRVYIPESIWPETKNLLLEQLADLKVGDVEDFTNYMGAVIDRNSFDNIKSYIDHARESSEAEIISGGSYDDSKGFFVDPTVIVTTNPKFKTMEEEIFGPVVTIYVYKDADYEEALDLCESTSEYALTGGIFAQDRKAIIEMEKKLCYSAGNLYINDKTTGAYVGLQPFGGARASGTNEKVGSKQNVSRWMIPRTIKECFNPTRDYRLPFMQES
ncbi:Delta-1-pyrroline-5-carboxylate dehydrogenase, mitochondrial [Desulfamplus magnetovallimortis]|uniref:L-glutamate gamma-semialdehyde dehydrogenase n=1 Tax=Desulfamplus magnetovallimortis TaxID=1246637 RepID=A0A1W1H6W6_9BACT|nr:L-glutamate gamma-semialdehyde dehydrogenase [Desulfamplus magnetovallimortis]SLM28207.1 Delta-1-pyrroline-5-carboxylate dehydrogenase, mitochondrial [Desulfamplus magnetovallimortis]